MSARSCCVVGSASLKRFVFGEVMATCSIACWGSNVLPLGLLSDLGAGPQSLISDSTADVPVGAGSGASVRPLPMLLPSFPIWSPSGSPASGSYKAVHDRDPFSYTVYPGPFSAFRSDSVPSATPRSTFRSNIGASDCEEQKWRDMLQVGISTYMFRHPHTFARRVRRGIPAVHRWEAWKDSVGYRDDSAGEACASNADDLYASLSRREGPCSEQIGLDVERTFTNDLTFDEGKRKALQRVLNAYANFSPDVGYCQGMNYVAGVLVSVAGEAREVEVFGVFVRLLDRDGLRGFYAPGMPLLSCYVQECERLVAEVEPELSEHLLREDVLPGEYLHKWFITLFVHIFPLPTVIVIWDVLLCQGFPMLLPIAVTVLKVLKSNLLSMEFENIVMCFKAMSLPFAHTTAAAQAGGVAADGVDVDDAGDSGSGYCDRDIKSAVIGQLLVRHADDIEVPEHIQGRLSVPDSPSDGRSQEATAGTDGPFGLGCAREVCTGATPAGGRRQLRRFRMAADGGFTSDFVDVDDPIGAGSAKLVVPQMVCKTRPVSTARSL